MSKRNLKLISINARQEQKDFEQAIRKALVDTAMKNARTRTFRRGVALVLGSVFIALVIIGMIEVMS